MRRILFAFVIVGIALGLSGVIAAGQLEQHSKASLTPCATAMNEVQARTVKALGVERGQEPPPFDKAFLLSTINAEGLSERAWIVLGFEGYETWVGIKLPLTPTNPGNDNGPGMVGMMNPLKGPREIIAWMNPGQNLDSTKWVQGHLVPNPGPSEKEWGWWWLETVNSASTANTEKWTGTYEEATLQSILGCSES